MPGKSKKVLESENLELNKELSDLKIKFTALSEKYETLEARCNTEKSSENLLIKCNKCDENFVTWNSYREHMKQHRLINDLFQCKHCSKEFDEEWKLSAHVKTHKKHKCEQCNKTFKYLDVLSKHIKIALEKVKIYCHYFNNMKTCPFGEECIFLHEDSRKCKYGKLCERLKCMFKHYDDEMEDFETEPANKTFQNPSQCDQSDKVFKCDSCIFSSATQNNLTKHQECNVCSICDLSMGCQTNLRDHKIIDHNIKN